MSVIVHRTVIRCGYPIVQIPVHPQGRCQLIGVKRVYLSNDWKAVPL